MASSKKSDSKVNNKLFPWAKGYPAGAPGGLTPVDLNKIGKRPGKGK